MATIKQKRAFKLVETGRNTGEIMVAAGYSPKTAKAPTKLTKSKGWEELMDKYLPDKLLAEKHKELLEVPIKTSVKQKGLATIETEMLDTFAISRGLDMGYKLKGRYVAEKIDLTTKGKSLNYEDDQRRKIAERIIGRKPDTGGGGEELPN